jgi:surface polysaccharide O-acyltransferase-like enzyme
MDMSHNSYVYSTVIAVCYVLFNILEMRFITDEATPLKTVCKNTLIVFFSSLCGFYIMSNSKVVDTAVVKPTEIFTGNPEF